MTSVGLYHARPAAPELRTSSLARHVLLACGVLASALYVAMCELIRYPGYSALSQTVSELSAIAAPTRTVWFWLGLLYTALAVAFGFGVWASAGGNRPLRVVARLILTAGFLGFVWPFAPMHQRAVLAAGGATSSDAMHVVLGSLQPLLFLLAVGFGAAAFGARFRLYSIATAVILLWFGVLTGLESPRIQANLPTPWVGLWERVVIVAYLLWAVVLAVTLLRVRESEARGSLQ